MEKTVNRQSIDSYTLTGLQGTFLRIDTTRLSLRAVSNVVFLKVKLNEVLRFLKV